MTIKKLAIAVTFHYQESRIKYLEKISAEFHSLADEVLVYIFTNTDEEDKISNIRRCVKQNHELSVEIHTPTYLGHPKLLTWSHLFIFRIIFNTDSSITHFMYVEDDILVTRKNIEYWIKGRQELEAKKVIPSFLRYECKDESSKKYSTDCTMKYKFHYLPKFKISDEYYYLNLREPYQGVYLLDRELMTEHLNGSSSIPEYTPWGISEKAAAGLTFMNIPYGCYSRNFIGYDIKKKRVDPNSLIHHLPNNYAKNLNSPHGKVRTDELIIFGYFSNVLGRVLDHQILPKIILKLLHRGKQKM